MQNAVIAFFAGIGIVGFLIILVPLGAALGAFSGWIVGMLFPALAAKVLAATGLAFYQVGALAGFIGPFFRSTQTNS